LKSRRKRFDLTPAEDLGSFALGAFWAIRTEVRQLLDWPGPRLIHADEDFLLGEALRQNFFRIENFNYGVKVNDAPRAPQKCGRAQCSLKESARGRKALPPPPQQSVSRNFHADALP
jgi:hypothetical protein